MTEAGFVDVGRRKIAASFEVIDAIMRLAGFLRPTTRTMQHRFATAHDVALLARLNRELVEDEGHAGAMSLDDFETRMRVWLEGEYSAVLFEEDGEVLGYALFRPIASGVYLRQFFVARGWRRRGHGRAALGLLRERIWPAGTTVTVDALVRNERAIAFWRALGFSDYAITLRSGWRAPGAG